MSSKEMFNKIWDALVKHAGADEGDRDSFIQSGRMYDHVLKSQLAKRLEFQFGGFLGFGGRVWITADFPYPFVNGYREDYTSKRRKIMDVTNEALMLIKV